MLPILPVPLLLAKKGDPDSVCRQFWLYRAYGSLGGMIAAFDFQAAIISVSDLFIVHFLCRNRVSKAGIKQ